MNWSSAAPSSVIFDCKIYVSPLAQMNVGDFQSQKKINLKTQQSPVSLHPHPSNGERVGI